MLQSKTIKAKLVPIRETTDADKAKMYQIFIKYYDNVTLKTFLKDFNKKDYVCMMRNRDNDIVGFSTMATIKVSYKGSTHLAIFSGDTIVEKKYWGSTALHLGFLSYLYLQRLRHPFSPIYWFLISKGYKTYLLMANNWKDYYPRYDKKPNPQIKDVMKLFCNSLFPGVYNDKTGLLIFGNDYQRLKENVAEIDEEMKRKYPKIAYFEEINPTWRDGTELPCLVEIDWFNILTSTVAFFVKKLFFKKKKCAAVTIERLPQANKESEYVA